MGAPLFTFLNITVSIYQGLPPCKFKAQIYILAVNPRQNIPLFHINLSRTYCLGLYYASDFQSTFSKACFFYINTHYAKIKFLMDIMITDPRHFYALPTSFCDAIKKLYARLSIHTKNEQIITNTNPSFDTL